MSKFIKSVSALAVIVIAALTLASCKYNFYNDWSNAGAEIEKENVFEVLEVDSAKAKVDADDTFVLVFGTTKAVSAAATVTTLQATADALEFDGTLYYVDCTDYINKPADRKMLKETFGLNDSNQISSNLVIAIYDKGELLLDTSDKLDDTKLKNFVDGESVNYAALATYIYTDFDFE